MKDKVKKKINGMYDYGNIHTGTNATHPGILKAKADKKKREANLAAYKKKTDAQKSANIKKGLKPIKTMNPGTTILKNLSKTNEIKGYKKGGVAKMKKGGMAKMMYGGMAKKMGKGGMAKKKMC